MLKDEHPPDPLWLVLPLQPFPAILDNVGLGLCSVVCPCQEIFQISVYVRVMKRFIFK